MKTVVQFQRSARDGLRSWLDRVIGPESLARFMRRLYADEIRDQLVRTDGLPLGTIAETGIEPPIYWWEFLPNVWIQYAFKTEGWFRKLRRVIVMGIWEEPPTDLIR